jgi:hypothetical protein
MQAAIQAPKPGARLERLKRVTVSDDEEDLGCGNGESVAKCIFCPGYSIKASSTKRYPGERICFRLVCRPSFRPAPINAREANLPPLLIGTR